MRRAETSAPPQRRGLRLAALLLAIACSVPAAAGIRIEVQGVDAELERNILALLSIARYTDRTRLEPDAVERLYRRVNDEVAGAVRPFGYYHPVINSKLTHQERGDDWLVRITVATGPPMIIDAIDVAVNGPGATDPVFTALLAQVPLRKGERLQHLTYDRFKSQLEAVALNYGYLDARWEVSQLRTETDANLASVHLHLATGSRYRFGPTAIHQDAIRDDRMRRLLQYSEGEPYNDLQRLRTQFALDDSLYFSSVNVNTLERDPATLVVPIDINAVGARRSYQFAAGYGDDTGARGSVSWLNPRVNSLGHRLQLRYQASLRLLNSDASNGLQQTFDARYDIPFGDLAREKMSLEFTAKDTPVSRSLTTSGLKLTPSITQVLGRWQRVLYVGVNRAITTNLDVPFIQPDGTTGVQNIRQVDNLAVPGVTYASVPEGYLGEALLSRTLLIDVQGSHRVIGADTNFARVDVQAEKSFPLRPAWRLLLRGEVGAINTKDITLVPGEYRFFAGGDRSVRGFGPNELSPISLVSAGPPPQYERQGGRYLLVGSIELQRDLPKKLALAVFTDFGNSMDKPSDPLAYSIGVGLRWRLPGLTFGIDIAKALHAPDVERAKALNVPGLTELPGPRLHLNISQTL
jgi:translocation and assembly module TamA